VGDRGQCASSRRSGQGRRRRTVPAGGETAWVVSGITAPDRHAALFDGFAPRPHTDVDVPPPSQPPNWPHRCRPVRRSPPAPPPAPDLGSAGRRDPVPGGCASSAGRYRSDSTGSDSGLPRGPAPVVSPPHLADGGLLA